MFIVTNLSLALAQNEILAKCTSGSSTMIVTIVNENQIEATFNGKEKINFNGCFRQTEALSFGKSRYYACANSPESRGGHTYYASIGIRKGVITANFSYDLDVSHEPEVLIQSLNCNTTSFVK